jgi:hypothetical protein
VVNRLAEAQRRGEPVRPTPSECRLAVRTCRR